MSIQMNAMIEKDCIKFSKTLGAARPTGLLLHYRYIASHVDDKAVYAKYMHGDYSPWI